MHSTGSEAVAMVAGLSVDAGRVDRGALAVDVTGTTVRARSRGRWAVRTASTTK